ncbi:MAG: cyanophycinase [Bacteroidia bacterium]|nr:cyanophycinase [Bacteroidia bacterium]
MVKMEIFERIINELKGVDSRIEIVTSASEIPGEIGIEYQKVFKKLKCKNIGVLHFKNSKEANLPENIDRLENCDGLLFTGGDQVLLSNILLKTNFLKRLKERYTKEKDFLISGTSAGAMALTQKMIAAGAPSESFVKGHIKITKGLNLLPHVIIDTHFIQRRRFSRLIEAIANYPDKLGIGLGEDTAVFFKTPKNVEIIGSNLVVLIDGTHISYNNISQIEKNQNICLQDVKLHILPKGNMFNIVSRKILNNNLNNKILVK